MALWCQAWPRGQGVRGACRADRRTEWLLDVPPREIGCAVGCLEFRGGRGDVRPRWASGLAWILAIWATLVPGGMAIRARPLPIPSTQPNHPMAFVSMNHIMRYTRVCCAAQSPSACMHPCIPATTLSAAAQRRCHPRAGRPRDGYLSGTT